MFTSDASFFPEYLFISLLLFSLVTDITEKTIPNLLVLLVLVSGFSTQLITNSYPGLINALIGVLAGFLIFLPFHLSGGMRGGDIKLMAACGAYMGIDTPLAAGLSLLAGSVPSLIVLYDRHGLRSYVSHYLAILLEFIGTTKFIYQPPANTEAAASSFPYAAAIVTGCLSVLFIFN